MTDQPPQRGHTVGTSVHQRLYLVCIHYGLSRERDWDWDGRRRLSVDYDPVAQRLGDDLVYLRQVLRPRQSDDGQQWEGFAFVFLDFGWTDLLGGVGGSAVRMAALGRNLANAQAEIESKLEQNDKLTCGSRRERIVTAGHLIDLLTLLDLAARDRDDSFYRLLFAGARTLRYDAPKVIEAAIRIANIGAQVPLFRFDDDVIFYGQRSPEVERAPRGRESAADETAENLMRLCNRYHEISMDPRVHYFVYSGGYDAPPVSNEDRNTSASSASGGCSNDPRLLNGFATRVLQLTQLPALRRDREAEDTTEGLLRSRVAMSFLEELYKLGANPFRQVVSGAGLCLSDSAILDLPPYSNMRLNVMWIDDHLKYALHDELGHFGRWTRTHHPHEARVPETRFCQLRHASQDGGPLFTYKDVRWHLQTYMLRLVLGCVADAWLREDPRVKLSTAELQPSEYERIARSVPGVYGEQFMGVIPGGWSDSEDAATTGFGETLWRRARERLNQVVRAWGADEYADTFLGLFVRGCEHERYEEFSDFFPRGMPYGLQRAVEELADSYSKAERPPPAAVLEEPHLEEALAILVDDFVEYLSLVEVWPSFVQSVRCLLNQDAQYQSKDLEWLFPVM